jgi:hypothetical protein
VGANAPSPPHPPKFALTPLKVAHPQLLIKGKYVFGQRDFRLDALMPTSNLYLVFFSLFQEFRLDEEHEWKNKKKEDDGPNARLR